MSAFDAESDVAIVGLACRVPGAGDVATLWRNLCEGTEHVTRVFDPQTGELVRAGGRVEALEDFDARFFGLGKRDAELIDPQQRMFFEACWTALESAGYADRTAEHSVGVFGGMGHSTYLLNNVWPGMGGDRDHALVDSPNDMRTLIACDKDFLTGRAAFMLDLRGPSMSVQAACASGPFSVHLACQALLAGECDMALAGAANASVPQLALPGLEDGTYVSRDGYTRSFDAAATGAVFGAGAGVVALKLLEDAIRDGDCVRAVVKGSAVNNDGSHKTGLTAPSVQAQQAVVEEALRVAGVEPEELGMIEAHGTATPIGDPIEVDALNRALGSRRRRSIALTTVKPNIGHLGWAAGIAGVIKSVLCLENGAITPEVNYSTPNPEIDFDAGPLHVPERLTEWEGNGRPRIAGVSSFGVTGYNAHIVLQEPPPRERPRSGPRRPLHVLAVSARSGGALETSSERWADAAAAPDADPADLAHTSNVRRPHMPLRRAAVGGSGEELAGALRAKAGRLPAVADAPRVAMLFTGYTTELRGLAGSLVADDAFRDVIDRAREPLLAEAGASTEDVLLSEPGATTGDNLVALHASQYVLQVALYEMWRSWGIEPAAMLGHSLGEFAAAYAADVFDLDAGVFLVAERARLYLKLPPDGAMAVLHASLEEAEEYCAQQPPGTAEVAAINGEANIVIAGRDPHITHVYEAVKAAGRRGKLLNYGRAGHCALVDPVLDEFGEKLSQVELRPPNVPFLSNLTGGAVTDEVTEVRYWQDHLRQPVRFSDGLASMHDLGVTAYLEVGPAPVLSGLALGAFPDFEGPVTGSLKPEEPSWARVLEGVCGLYEHGVDVDWAALERSGGGQPVAAPTYGFDRQRHWIESPRGDPDAEPARLGLQLLHEAVWHASGAVDDQAPALPGRHYLLVPDRGGVAEELARTLDASGSICTVARPDGDERAWESAYSVVEGADRETLAEAITDSGIPFSGVIVCRGLDLRRHGDEPAEGGFAAVEDGLLDVLAVLQALADVDTGLPCRLLTRGAASVDGPTGDEQPAQAAICALARSAALENPDQEIGCIDLDPAGSADVASILDGLAYDGADEVAHRAGSRYDRRLVRARDVDPPPAQLDPEAVYVVTGGLGALGLILAETLVTRGARQLVLAARGEPTDAALGRIEAMRARAGVSTVRADVSVRANVDELIAHAREGGRRIAGVAHLAGTIDDATVSNMTREKVRGVLAGKARGAWNLHEALGDDPDLDFFTCFSSAASLIGNAGQTNYSAANGFVDSLVSLRLAQGRPGLSLAWGAWADVGLLAEERAILTALEARGMGALPHDVAVALLAELVPSARGSIGIVNYEWRKWCADMRPRHAAGFVELLEEGATGAAETNGDAPADELLDISGLSGDELAEVVRGEVVATINEVLGFDPGNGAAALEMTASLPDLGLDSFSAIQLRSRLKARLGINLPLSDMVALQTVQDVVDTAIGCAVPGEASVV